jgi:hypothetical protein
LVKKGFLFLSSEHLRESQDQYYIIIGRKKFVYSYLKIVNSCRELDLYIPGDGAGVTGTLSKVKFEYVWWAGLAGEVGLLS